MKKFPMLDTLLKLFIALTVGLLEKICILLYCLLPIGFFMLMMSFRSKNHKTTAISTFTNDNSEFQHIFPNYILVIVEPKWLKKGIDKRVKEFSNFIEKYKYVLMALAILSVIAILLVGLYLYLIVS